MVEKMLPETWKVARIEYLKFTLKQFIFAFFVLLFYDAWENLYLAQFMAMIHGELYDPWVILHRFLRSEWAIFSGGYE